MSASRYLRRTDCTSASVQRGAQRSASEVSWRQPATAKPVKLPRATAPTPANTSGTADSGRFGASAGGGRTPPYSVNATSSGGDTSTAITRLFSPSTISASTVRWRLPFSSNTNRCLPGSTATARPSRRLAISLPLRVTSTSSRSRDPSRTANTTVGMAYSTSSSQRRQSVMMNSGQLVWAQTSSSARASTRRPALRSSWARSYEAAQASPSEGAAARAGVAVSVAGASASTSATGHPAGDHGRHWRLMRRIPRSSTV